MESDPFFDARGRNTLYLQKMGRRGLKYLLLLCSIAAMYLFFFRPETLDGKKVITHYKTNVESGYTVPSAGEISFATDVRQARTSYAGEDVQFLLTWDVSRQGEELSQEALRTEYQRMLSAGYALYTTEYWTYHGEGEKIYLTAVVGAFTESELSMLNIHPDYGYFFSFLYNGDGSGISVESLHPITNLHAYGA